MAPPSAVLLEPSHRAQIPSLCTLYAYHACLRTHAQQCCIHGHPVNCIAIAPLIEANLAFQPSRFSFDSADQVQSRFQSLLRGGSASQHSYLLVSSFCSVRSADPLRESLPTDLETHRIRGVQTGMIIPQSKKVVVPLMGPSDLIAPSFLCSVASIYGNWSGGFLSLVN